MKNRVLITSVGRKVSLIKVFKDAGWYVIGKDDNHDSLALKFCNEIYKLGIDNFPDLWIPTRDAEIKDAYEFNGWPTKYIDTCIDKLKFCNWCKANGFRTPEVYFVKPRISSSGKETECVWQEMVDGEEYSIDCFSDFQKNVISIVPRKRLKVTNGESSCTQTIHSPLLVETAISLSQALGLVGHSVMQCFLSQGNPIWTDINCRFGGASIVGIQAGCNSPEWLLRLLNGEKVEPCIGDYKVGLTGMSYTDWSFYED